jgi:PAS domain S-box-containing protein
MVTVPCIQEGRWVSALTVNTRTARNWREDEVTLLQETVARLWSIIEQIRALQALRESEYQYRTLFETIDQGFCVCQMLFDENDEPSDYRFLEVNPVFGQMTGLQQAKGKTARQLVPNLEDFWIQTYGRVVLTGEPIRFENQSKAMNRWFNVSAFRFDERQNDKFAVLFTNITDRKQAEVALTENNNILQAVISGTNDIIYVKDLQGRYVMSNQAAAQWLNITVNSMMGQDDLALFPAEVAQRIQTEDRRVIDANESVIYEEQLLKGDELRSLLTGKYPWRNEQGEVKGIIGISRDVTDFKQVEADLQQRNEYIQILYETSRDLLSTYQPLALIDALFTKLKPLIGLDIYFNYIIDQEQQKLHLMFDSGISEEVAREIEWLEIGQAICGTVAQQRCQIVQANLQQSTDPKTELARSLGLTAYSCQPLIFQGKLFGTLGFGSRTRTKFTSAETKLFQAICDRIAIALERSELVSSLQQQTEELTRANRLKDEFLAALSHELRTPLNPIMGWTKLLQTQKLTLPKTQEALSTIERNVKQQIALVEDLLDISRVVQGQFKLTSQPVDLAPILNAARDSVRFAAIAKSITLELHYPVDSISQVMGDELRLQQVFWNLLSNAIKFTPDDGRVDVWLEQVQNDAQIRITDTGIGIAAEFLPYVFDRFRQADGSSTRRYGGLGLGLALVKHLVELHGGTVSVESLGEGRGATFKVNLPLLKSASSNPGTSNSQQPQTDLSSSVTSESLTGIRVLVVDDQPDNLDLLDFVLKQEGAIVTTVTCATEALAIISENPPDILISDIGMPDMDGYELLRQVRALPNQQNKPIKAIALTAFAQQEDRERMKNAGFQAYLAKPCNLVDLIEAIAFEVGNRK